MNALVNKALAAIEKLPEAEQEAIARDLLDRLAADARWGALFADPRSDATLSRLAREAREDAQQGHAEERDPSDRRA